MRKKILFSLMLSLASLFGAAQCELLASFEYVPNPNSNSVNVFALESFCPQADSVTYQWVIGGSWVASGMVANIWVGSQENLFEVCLIVSAYQSGEVFQADDWCQEVYMVGCNINAQFATITATPNQVSFQVVEVWGGSGPYSYVWTGNNPVGSTTTQPTVVFENPQYPFYGIVQITDANGCTGTFTVVAEGPAGVCVANIEFTQEGYNYNFSAAGTSLSNSFIWSLNGLVVSNWSQLWLNLEPGVHVITLEVFNNQTGCSETDTIEVVVPEPITICGYAYADTNNNGVMDEGEQGVEGVSFYSYPDSTVTDANGFYELQVYPGSFTIQGSSDFTGYSFVNGIEDTWHMIEGNQTENMTECNLNWPMEDYSATVCGIAFLDSNQNGIYDDEESPLAGAQIVYYSWTGQELVEDIVAYTNENGHYCITVPAGWVYLMGLYSTTNSSTLTVPIQLPNGLSAGQVVDNANLAFYFLDDVIEVGVNVSSWNNATPGFGGNYLITLENVGSLSATVDVTLDFPMSQAIQTIPQLNGVAGVVDNATNTITWSGVVLGGFETIGANIIILNSVSTPLGSIVNVVAGAFVTNGTDVYLPNNTYAMAQTVVGSYDPNNKLNQPEGVGSTGDMLPTNDEFVYTINFQNTGTAPAYTVRVEDQLDTDLDWSTFEMIHASHDYIVQMQEGKLVWTFNNIMLPDSTTDEPNSHGHIIFRIKPIADKPVGTVFENTAYIYFDFNEPIITNTATITFVTTIDVAENESAALSIYPNPASEQVTIVSDLLDGNAIIRLLDVQGRVIMNEQISAKNRVEIPVRFESGHYILQIQNGVKIQTSKLLVK